MEVDWKIIAVLVVVAIVFAYLYFTQDTEKSTLLEKAAAREFVGETGSSEAELSF